MIKKVLIVILSMLPLLAEAQTASEAQEFMQIYLSGPTRTGDLNSLEEMQQIGQIKELLEELPKEEYIQSLDFLRQNWNINTDNSQRLFLFLQRSWQNNQGLKLATIDVTSQSVATEVGLLSGIAATSVYAAKLMLPLLAAKRNPLQVLKFNWSSGLPVATTFGAAFLLPSEFRTKEAVQYAKTVRPSPASVLRLPMAQAKDKEITLSEHEISDLYSKALAFGMTGFAYDLLNLRKIATGAKVAGSTAGRVVLVIGLTAAIGYAAEQAIDTTLQQMKYDDLKKDLEKSVSDLNLSAPNFPTAQLIAQNVYAKTNNLMQLQLLNYYKAAQENTEGIRVLPMKLADETFKKQKGGWSKDSAEVDLHFALKDLRDAYLSTQRNEECQYQVDLYLMLNSVADAEAVSMADHFSDMNLRSQKDLTEMNAFIEKQKQLRPEALKTAEQVRTYTQKLAQTRLEKLTDKMAKGFSDGKICGGAFEGHPLHLLLSASLYLKKFSKEKTWIQTNALDQSFFELFEARMESLKKIESPSERKIREGELMDISEVWKRKGFKPKSK